MKKALVILTITLISLSTLQTNAQVIDSKTTVTEVDIAWSEYSEIFPYENKTYEGLKLTIDIKGELWNSANNDVEIAFGSSSCPDFGKSESNFSISHIDLPINQACTDDYGVATYVPGLSNLSDELSILFLNQTLETMVSGSILVSFPMINLLPANIFTTLVTFTNSQAYINYSTLPADWGAIANNDLSETSDDFLELGLSFLQSLVMAGSSFMILILLKRDR